MSSRCKVFFRPRDGSSLRRARALVFSFKARTWSFRLNYFEPKIRFELLPSPTYLYNKFRILNRKKLDRALTLFTSRLEPEIKLDFRLGPTSIKTGLSLKFSSPNFPYQARAELELLRLDVRAQRLSLTWALCYSLK